MALSPVLLALLVLYPLVQVPAVLYLSRYLEMDGDVATRPPAGRYWEREAGGDGGTSRERSAADGTGEAAGSGLTCPDCGARNLRTFRFCRRCVTRLSG